VKVYNCYAFVVDELEKTGKSVPTPEEILHKFRDGRIYDIINSYIEVPDESAMENDVILWGTNHIGILKRVEGFLMVHHYSNELKTVIKEDFTNHVKQNTKILRV